MNVLPPYTIIIGSTTGDERAVGAHTLNDLAQIVADARRDSMVDLIEIEHDGTLVASGTRTNGYEQPLHVYMGAPVP